MAHATIKQGSSGTEVVLLQSLLLRVGHRLTVAKPLTSADIGSAFGPKTKAMVEKFQHDFIGDSAVDGIVGPVTWAALIDVSQFGERFFPTLSLNASGPVVTALQNTFNTVEFVNFISTGPLAVTGTYDSKTATAVKDLQRVADLTADGVLGRKTWLIDADRFTTTSAFDDGAGSLFERIVFLAGGVTP